MSHSFNNKLTYASLVICLFTAPIKHQKSRYKGIRYFLFFLFSSWTDEMCKHYESAAFNKLLSLSVLCATHPPSCLPYRKQGRLSWLVNDISLELLVIFTACLHTYYGAVQCILCIYLSFVQKILPERINHRHVTMWEWELFDNRIPLLSCGLPGNHFSHSEW